MLKEYNSGKKVIELGEPKKNINYTYIIEIFTQERIKLQKIENFLEKCSVNHKTIKVKNFEMV